MVKKYLCWLMIMFLSLPASADQAVDAVHSHQEVLTQAEGNYPELKRESSVPLASIQRAWDDAGSGAGVRMIYFDPKETIRLVLREYMATTLIFPPWEHVEQIIVGDEGNYQVNKLKDNIVTVKPMNYIGMDTNITLIGESGHVYGFYTRTEGYNSRNISDITVKILALAPPTVHASAKKIAALSYEEEKPDYLEETFADRSELDFSFSMSGDRSIAPDLVYTDGVRTWFYYAEDLNKRKIPTFFITVDGLLKAINVTLDKKKNRLVAHEAGSFLLKSGKKITCIYPTENKGKKT